MIINILIVLIFLIFGLFIIYQSNQIGNEFAEFLLRRSLRFKIESALRKKYYSKNDIDVLAKSLGFQSKVAHKVCLKIQSKIIEGKLPDIENKKEILDQIIIDYEKSQPFEELPPDIKYSLIAINNNYKGEYGDIDRLNISIKSILDNNDKESKKQRYINYISFAIGILSFAFAIYTQFSK